MENFSSFADSPHVFVTQETTIFIENLGGLVRGVGPKSGGPLREVGPKLGVPLLGGDMSSFFGHVVSMSYRLGRHRFVIFIDVISSLAICHPKMLSGNIFERHDLLPDDMSCHVILA